LIDRWTDREGERQINRQLQMDGQTGRQVDDGRMTECT